MKTITKIIIIILTVIMSVGGTVLLYTECIKRCLRKITRRKEQEKEILRKEGELRYRKEEFEKERIKQFYQDLEDGKICKMFYDTFKDLFNFPELPEGYVFPDEAKITYFKDIN